MSMLTYTLLVMLILQWLSMGHACCIHILAAMDFKI